MSAPLLIIQGKMFWARNCLQVFWVITLDPFYKGEAKPGGEERIFTITLLSSAPARVAGHFNNRCPEGESRFLQSGMETWPGFIRHRIAHLPNGFFIPGCPLCNSHGEDRRKVVGPGDNTVPCFTTPEVSRNSKTFKVLWNTGNQLR